MPINASKRVAEILRKRRKAQDIFLACFFLFWLVVLVGGSWLILTNSQQCIADGGVYVRGIFWFECIKGKS